jgi:hypothetical protein
MASAPSTPVLSLPVACTQFYQPVAMTTLESYSTTAQVLVATAVKLLRSHGMDKSLVKPVAELRTAFEKLCKRCSVPHNSSEFLELLERIQADGFVNVGSHKDPTKRPVSLVVAVDDVQFALQDRPFWKMSL